LVILPNRGSYTGSLALLFSGKLINQLDEILLGLAALEVVSAIEIRVRLVALVTSVDSISGFTGIIVYWLLVSWPTFFGIFIT
jgi:hypothetical protein